MSNFTVRVELHKAIAADYEALHEAMEDGGFSRVVKGARGSWHLPEAEYTIASTRACEEIRDAANAIAGTIKARPAILVTEVATRCWTGLKEA
jgi:hypothetical protein